MIVSAILALMLSFLTGIVSWFGSCQIVPSGFDAAIAGFASALRGLNAWFPVGLFFTLAGIGLVAWLATVAIRLNLFGLDILSKIKKLIW
jgi:hypothetical protein